MISSHRSLRVLSGLRSQLIKASSSLWVFPFVIGIHPSGELVGEPGHTETRSQNALLSARLLHET